MNIPINSIVKYIKMVYNPYDITIHENNDYDPPIFELTLYFHEIDDRYHKNKKAKSRFENKEENFAVEIRGEISKLFSVKIIGVNLINDKFLSFESKGNLIINVKTDEKEQPKKRST